MIYIVTTYSNEEGQDLRAYVPKDNLMSNPIKYVGTGQLVMQTPQGDVPMMFQFEVTDEHGNVPATVEEAFRLLPEAGQRAARAEVEKHREEAMRRQLTAPRGL